MVVRYKGVGRSNRIELPDRVTLPEGTEVQVVICNTVSDQSTKGSRDALLAAFDRPPLCDQEDVDALIAAIEHGKRPVQTHGVFDEERRST